jgi:hypothetical protein
MTSTRNVLEAWPQDDDEETDQPEIGEETNKARAQQNEVEDEEDAEAVAVRKGEERRERKKQLKWERREKRERKREEKEGKKMEKKTNNRGREEDAEKRALREAEEEEEDMRVLLAACQLQGETRNQTAFACSGRTKDQKKTESAKKKGGKEKSPEPKVKKSRRERKLEKREDKKDKKQRKIDKELQKQREKEEKRRRNRGHARSSSDGAALASSNINSAAGLSSSASMPSITKPKKSWRPSTWRMSSIACLGRAPSMDGEDSPLQTSSDSHSLDGPRGDKGSTSRRRSSIEKGKDKQDHEGDDDPDKKSGPGKVLEEGTIEPCGEDGEDEGWSEESVEWCGVKYAKNDMPPFDTSGLRGTCASIWLHSNPHLIAFLLGKTAYNPNHCLWLATAAALAYRSPAQIRHVVTRIWGTAPPPVLFTLPFFFFVAHPLACRVGGHGVLPQRRDGHAGVRRLWQGLHRDLLSRHRVQQGLVNQHQDI